MTSKRRRATLGAAVTFGILGGGLLGVGGVGLASAEGARPVCPVGTTLYQPVAPTDAAVPVTAEEIALAAVPVEVDPTDPFASGVPLDPDSYVCVPDDPDFMAILPSPAASPASSPQPSPVPSPEVVEVTPSPTPDAIPAQDPPGLIPLPAAPQSTPTPVPTSTPVPTPLPAQEPNDPNPEDPGDGNDPPGNNQPITRAQVIGRSVSWVLQQVPYSQTSWWTDANGTYRQDCSGYVSMAWRLDQRVNYWTGNLATVSHRIASKDLRVGDALLLPRSHVVLFAGWANTAKTKFNLYEEYSRGKPARYVTNANLSYYLDRGYGAYRYDHIDDVKVGKAGPRSTVFELASAEQATDGVPWTEAAAASVQAEATVPSGLDDTVTPMAVPDLPVATLVAAQQAVDGRADVAAATGSSALMLLVGGGALMFLTVPLVVAARTGEWNR